MLALKVPLPKAEKWKLYLSNNDMFDNTCLPKKDGSFIYYPVKRRFSVIKGDVEFQEMKFDKRKISGTLRTNLKEILSDEEQEFLKTSHDVIGNIAILEIPERLKKREKLIAETLLKTNKNITTVLKKAASHEGVFRTQKMKYLAGLDTKEATYKENGVVMRLDVENVYFSVRLSNERKRIANLIRPQEDVLVMFSGCAPYPVVFAKNTKAKHILGIEINPAGHDYGLKNLKLNKIKNVDLICGDVHKIIPELKEKNPQLSFDRIVMPLPKTADEFLGDALSVSKKGTIIHFYDFLDENKFDEAKEKIMKACKKSDMEFKILDFVKCGQHAPHIYRICVDFQIV